MMMDGLMKDKVITRLVIWEILLTSKKQLQCLQADVQTAGGILVEKSHHFTVGSQS